MLWLTKRRNEYHARLPYQNVGKTYSQDEKNSIIIPDTDACKFKQGRDSPALVEHEKNNLFILHSHIFAYILQKILLFCEKPQKKIA